MWFKKHLSPVVCLLSTLFMVVPAASQADVELASGFKVSGFGRVIGGYLDTGDAAYLDYTDEIKFDSQSLAALQIDWQIPICTSLSGRRITDTKKTLQRERTPLKLP